MNRRTEIMEETTMNEVVDDTVVWTVCEPGSEVEMEMEFEESLDGMRAGRVMDAVLDRFPELKGRTFLVKDEESPARVFLWEFDRYLEFECTGWDGCYDDDEDDDDDDEEEFDW